MAGADVDLYQEFRAAIRRATVQLGAAFATVEVKAMLARLLVRAELDPISRPIRPDGYIAMRPRLSAIMKFPRLVGLAIT